MYKVETYYQKYYKANKETIKLKQNIYREANKAEKYLYYINNKEIPCEECDTYVAVCNKIRHEKTQKRLDNLKLVKKIETRIIVFD
jgi:hypothetical protein